MQFFQVIIYSDKVLNVNILRNQIVISIDTYNSLNSLEMKWNIDSKSMLLKIMWKFGNFLQETFLVIL